MSVRTALARRFAHTRSVERQLHETDKALIDCNDALEVETEKHERWRKYAHDLEEQKGVRDIADLTTLASAVIEYRRCLSMLGAADPVDARLNVERIFEKYNINLPERPFD